MNEWLIISVGILLVIVALMGVFVWKRRGKPREAMSAKIAAKTFFLIGIAYMIIAFVTNNLIMGREYLAALFNIGVIFFIIGLAGMAWKKYKPGSKESLKPV